MSKFCLAPSEARSLKHLNSHQYFESRFNFLNSHNGLRVEKFHLLIGTTGSGKSTFVRSLILDFLKQNPSKALLLILSEETEMDLKHEFAKTDFIDLDSPKIYVIQEDGLNFKNSGEYFNFIENFIKENKIDLMIFDNLTTSMIYNDKKPEQQFAVSLRLKSITKRLRITTLIIAHTGSLVSDNSTRLINETDIRGSKSITNLVEFLYILQRFDISGHFFQTIRIVKHRSQDPAGKIYRLIYDRESSIYKSDLVISFKNFKEAYDKRSKL